MPPVSALLFDLGGVVIDIDVNRIFARWAEHAGCDVEHIARRARFDGPYHRYERGEINVQAFFAHLRSSLDVNLTDAQFLDGWNSIFVGEIPGIVSVLQAMRGRVPLYAFSNTNGAHVDCFSKRFAGLLSNFDRVFVSSAIGHRKPEAGAFAHVVKEIDLPATSILFFDDLMENVAGAQAAGLQAVHVKTAHCVADALERKEGQFMV